MLGAENQESFAFRRGRFKLKKISTIGFLSFLSCQFLFAQTSPNPDPETEKDSWVTVSEEDQQAQKNEDKEQKKHFPYNIIFNINGQKDSLKDRPAQKDESVPVLAKTAEENDKVRSSLNYFEFGVGPLPIFLPSFGFGIRQQAGHHGSDFSVKTATVIEITKVSADLLYHYYPKPNLSSQFYLGAGLEAGGIFGKSDNVFDKKAAFLLSPELVLGRQFKNKTDDARFIQLKMGCPTFATDGKHHGITFFPFAAVSYGFCF